MVGVPGVMGAWLAEIRDLLIPRGCAGCDRPDYALCPRCATEFRQCEAWREPVSGVACYACASYRGFARRAVLSWKDHGDLELDAVFSDAIARMVRSCVAAGRLDRSGVPVGSQAPVLVVPAPSSFASVSRRGRRQVTPLANAVAEGLAACGVEARAVEALRMRGVHAKAVQTASGRDRAGRIAGRIVPVRPVPMAGARVILVDDIITTGATIRQCAQVVERESGTVVAAVALARTHAPGRYAL